MLTLLTRWRRLLLVAPLIAGTTLTACNQDTQTELETHPVTGDTLAEDQVFTHRVPNEPSSLDPQRVSNLDDTYIVRDLFEGLLNTDSAGNLIPGVARRFQSENDNQTWTFLLREDARWSDGTRVTAEDFVYAWQRAVDPEVGGSYSWYMALMSIENGHAILRGDKPVSELGIMAVDNYTFRVQLNKPLPYFPQMVTHPITFPVPKWAIEQHGGNWTRAGNLVGNGAFTLTEHVVNQRLVRQPNSQYWDQENSHLDKVTTLVVNNEDQALGQYEAGNVDMTDISSGQHPTLEAERPDEAHAVPAICTYFYSFNTEAPPFDDARVRRALSYAIDRDAITDTLQGGQQAAYTFTPGSIAGFNPPQTSYGDMTQAERDQRARELMAEAGYGPGNPLSATILYNDSHAHRDIAATISRRWAQTLDVHTTLESQPWKDFLNTRAAGGFEIARGGWCGDYNEASSFLNLMHSTSGYNDANYESGEYDRMLESTRTLPNPSEVYTQLERLIATDMPNTPIYHYSKRILLKPNVKGWPFDDIQQNVRSKTLYIEAQ